MGTPDLPPNDGIRRMPEGCDLFSITEDELRKREADGGVSRVVHAIQLARYSPTGGREEALGRWPAGTASIRWIAETFGAGAYSAKAVNDTNSIVTRAEFSISPSQVPADSAAARGVAPSLNGHGVPHLNGAAPAVAGFTSMDEMMKILMVKIIDRALAPPASSSGSDLLAQLAGMQAQSAQLFQAMMASQISALSVTRAPQDAEAGRTHALLLAMMTKPAPVPPALPPPAPVIDHTETIFNAIKLGRDFATPPAAPAAIEIEPPEPDPPWLKAVTTVAQELGPGLVAMGLSKYGGENASDLLKQLSEQGGPK